MKSPVFLLPVFFAVIHCSISAQDILKANSGAIITVQNGAVVYLNGGIHLDNGSALSNAGVITIAKTNTGTADFTDNTSAAYNYSAGKFVFTGNGSQTINSINQFERIDVDNAGLNLSSDIKSNTWYLISGIVNTGSFTAVATTAADTAVQADPANANFSSSWINGKLQRSITPASVNNYQFPMGDSTKVNIAEMDNLMANPLTGVSNITASFGRKQGTDIGLNVSESGTPYVLVNTGGVWYLTPDANPSGGVYDLKLYFNNFTDLADNSFGILRRPDSSSNAADWIVPIGSLLPSAGNLGRTVAGGYARRNNISTFSQFGIGMSADPLAVELLSFTAVKGSKNVLLQWVTSNELNTSYFEIYRSGQSGSMKYLDKVAAAGSSSIRLNYQYTDLNPLNGFNFYQLKIVDIDNNFKLSQIVHVDFDEADLFYVFPNPVTNNEFFIQHDGYKIDWLKLFASDGRLMKSDFVDLSPNQISVNLQPSITKGAYTVQVGTDKGIRTTMILIQ
jgi:hypothetical protein